MLSRLLSATLIAIEAHPVEVEGDITSTGMPHFSLKGLPDTAVKESRGRVRSALKNAGFVFTLKTPLFPMHPLKMSYKNKDREDGAISES